MNLETDDWRLRLLCRLFGHKTTPTLYNELPLMFARLFQGRKYCLRCGKQLADRITAT